MREWTLSAVLLLATSLPAQVPSLPTARLEGKVVDPLQQPVPSAEVTAEVDGEIAARTQTDAQGTFVFGRLRAGYVIVRATTAAPDIGASEFDLIGNRREFVLIVTVPARKVTGVLRDDHHQVVPGAWISAVPYGPRPFNLASTITVSDANGHFELTHVPLGAAQIRAWAPGCDAFAGSIERGVNTIECTLERDVVQQQRFRLRDATPAQLAKATLHVECRTDGVTIPLPPPLLHPHPDADGAWVLRGWPYGDEMNAWLELPGATISPPLCTALADRGSCNYSFRIDDDANCLQGRLTGPDGLALGNCDLLARPMRNDGADVRQRSLGRTRPDGTFKMPSPVDRGDPFALRVFAGGAVVDGQDPLRAWYVANFDSKPLTIPVHPAQSIHLTCVTASGAVAPGAMVNVYAALAVAQNDQGLRDSLHSQGPSLAFGTSDLDGHVDIAGLDLHQSELLACLVTCPDGWAEVTFTVPANGDIQLGRVVLQPAATVRGIVKGADHAGVSVSYQPFRSFAFSRTILITDRSGRFCISGLLPGDYFVFPSSSNAATSGVRFEPGENEIER